MTKRLAVPKGLKRNLEFRAFLLARAEADAGVRAALLAHCAADPVFWIDAFVFQYNPNAIKAGSSREEGPFILWGYQEEALATIDEWIEDRADGVIEKSREMGASWLCLLKCLHRYLFRRNQKFLVISRNADSVDKPDEPDSLFWKLDYVLDHLPDWMTAGKVKRRKMGFKNPILNSYITGQATTGKAGVGGRCTAMFLDEFSQIDEDREVFARTKHTTACRIFNGTHVGTATMFYELCDPSSAVYGYIRRLRIHWSQHPDKARGLYRVADSKVEVLDDQYDYPEGFAFVKDGRPSGGFAPGVRSPWYDRMCEGMVGNSIAMDLDIDAHASVVLFFEPVLIRRLMAEARPPLWTGMIVYDTATGKPRSLEKGEGPLALWIHPKLDGVAPASRYTIAADIAFGTGKTPSCASIVDAAQGRKIGSYVWPWILPPEFAELCVALGWMFADAAGTPALLGWDGHGPCGSQFKNRVVALGYRNIHYRQNENLLTAKQSDEPGMFYGQARPKAGLLSDYQVALRKGTLANPDRASLEECLAFMHDGKGGAIHKKEKVTDDPASGGENHADRAFADALNCRLVRDWLDGGKKSEAKSEALVPGTLEWMLALRAMQAREYDLV